MLSEAERGKDAEAAGSRERTAPGGRSRQVQARAMEQRSSRQSASRHRQAAPHKDVVPALAAVPVRVVRGNVISHQVQVHCIKRVACQQAPGATAAAVGPRRQAAVCSADQALAWCLTSKTRGNRAGWLTGWLPVPLGAHLRSSSSGRAQRRGWPPRGPQCAQGSSAAAQ